MSFARTDRSAVAQWWWTVDRWTLVALAALIGFGSVLVMAASPSVAEHLRFADHLHIDRLHFVWRYFTVLPAAMAVMFATSLQSPRTIRRIALAGFVVSLALLAATLFIGVEIKGARRWIALPGMAMQPSEFLKPCFTVVAAWLISEGRRSPGFPGMWIAFAIFGAILLLLKSQPDIGMLAVIVVVFFCQLYIGGLNLFLVAGSLGMIGGGAVMAYLLFPHVQSRVQRFWHPESGDTYQVTTALEAFGNGGLFGRGPGEGRVKDVLPDAHADFVYAVAGEEYGMLVCVLILGVFAFIVLRGLLRLVKEQDLFVVLACSGLVSGFGLQAFVNMASTLKLIPTKGMTLPFISYGGSSVIAVALGMGMLLALTRNRHHGDTP